MRRLRVMAMLALPLLWAVPAEAQYGPRGWGDPRPAPPARALGQEELSASARRLASQAQSLHRTTRRFGDPELARRSADLARAAQRFDQVLRSPVPPDRVMREFEMLQTAYYDLRVDMFELNQAQTIRGLSNEWTRIAATFEQLALAFGADPNAVCALEPRYGRRGSDRGWSPY